MFYLFEAGGFYNGTSAQWLVFDFACFVVTILFFCLLF